MPVPALLELEDVSVSFSLGEKSVEVVSGASFSVEAGKTLALVGESGCGKSVTASSVMRLLPQPHGRVTSGAIRFQGVDVLSLPLGEMHRLRGGKMAMIFQEPMTALNPVHPAGAQIKEVLELHREDIPAKARAEAVLGLLGDVDMPSPAERARAYPFQLSGGMRQRVMIAMALAGMPELLIADEPTTALDVTVQAQILDLIRGLQEKKGMGVLYITHDMGVVAQIAHDVAVMYAGWIVEKGPVEEIFASPLHPYTRGLIASMPSLISEPKARLPSIKGQVPSPADYPSCCRFADRCELADDHCRSAAPELREEAPGRFARCFKAGQG
jgi:peptide/nickel transport system ATP-binding protein